MRSRVGRWPSGAARAGRWRDRRDERGGPWAGAAVCRCASPRAATLRMAVAALNGAAVGAARRVAAGAGAA
eukprot:4055663-Prymnesium_polylepis.1